MSFDINQHLQQMGFGRGKPGDSKDPANEETSIDYVAEKAAAKVGTSLFEKFGIDLQEFGKSGIQRALGGDSEGIAGKTIMPSMLPDSQGGFLARLMHSIFLKNREITDHTGGTGGGGGDYSGGGGGGGGDYSGGGGGGDFGGQGMAHHHFEDYTPATPSFDWSSISWASLGGLPRPSLPDMGPGQDVGAGIG